MRRRALSLAALAWCALAAPDLPATDAFHDACLATADVLLDGIASQAERLAAANTICNSFAVSYGVWCPYFYQRYVEPEKWTDAELDRVEQAFWVGAEMRAQAYGATSHAPWSMLGEAALVEERYADALTYYENAIARFANPAAGGKDLATCLYGRANALLGLGRTNEAFTALSDYLSRGLPSFGGRYEEHIDSYASVAVQFLGGRDLDLLKMPRYTGAKAFPEPQQADYSNAFVTVTAYDLEVSGLDARDRRLELLDTKFTRFGAPRQPGAAFTVRITVDPATRAFVNCRNPYWYAAFRARRHAERDAPFGCESYDKSPKTFRPYMEREAYTLEVTESGATIVAKTKQGALWGIVSLIQLWDQPNRRIRLAKILDWPDVETRGYLGDFWNATLEFTLFNKMNSVCHQTHPCSENVFRPVNWFIEAFMGQEFHDFGLELFFGQVWMTQAPQLPISSHRTLPFRTAVCRRYASAHIGVYYPLDDIRYPICDQDLAAYGDQIGAIDGQHQNAIFQAVIADYPDWRMVVCPPPYMGPDAKYSNAESRDHYLESWSAALDPRVEGYWTGPRVRSNALYQYHLDWVRARYGRRPYFFQNGMAWHNNEHYTVDHTGWPEFYCEDALDIGIKGYHLNGSTPAGTPRSASLADALWNLGRFVSGFAIERGLEQVSGERMYDLLFPALDDLSYFDKYVYGEINDSFYSENRDTLLEKAANVERCWAAAQAYAAEIGAPIYGSFGAGVSWMRNVMSHINELPETPKPPKPSRRAFYIFIR